MSADGLTFLGCFLAEEMKCNVLLAAMKPLTEKFKFKYFLKLASKSWLRAAAFRKPPVTLKNGSESRLCREHRRKPTNERKRKPKQEF
jgi:hypothetical protein